METPSLPLSPEVVRILSEGIRRLDDGDSKDHQVVRSFENTLASMGFCIEDGILLPLSDVRQGYVKLVTNDPGFIIIRNRWDGQKVGSSYSPLAVEGPQKVYFDPECTIPIGLMYVEKETLWCP